MTKDEAQEKVKSTRRNRKNIFCPIIQNSCRENCECYSEKVWRIPDDNMGNPNYKYFAGCNNYSLWGPME